MLTATVFAEGTVENMKPEELAAALKDKKITEDDLPKITSAQMTDDVLNQVPNLAKLKKEELQKKFGLNSLNVDLKDKPLKYQKGLLLHPQGATLDIAKFNDYSTKANEAGYSLKVDESGFTLKKTVVDGNN